MCKSPSRHRVWGSTRSDGDEHDEERPRGNRVGRNYPPETQRKEQEMTTKWNVRRTVFSSKLLGEVDFSALFSGFSQFLSVSKSVSKSNSKSTAYYGALQRQ